MTVLIAIVLVLLPFLAVSALLIEAARSWGADDTAWMDTIRA